MDISLALTARRLAVQLSDLAAIAAAVADEAVWMASRTGTAEQVAEAMGVSVPAVRKAIRLHNRRKAARLSV